MTGELEPNDTFAAAAASPLHITGDTVLEGTLPPFTDEDNFRLTIAAPTVVRFETFTSLFRCEGRLTILVFDLQGNVAGNGHAGCGEFVAHLTAGTYYLRIFTTGTVLAHYFLEVDYQIDRGSELEPPSMLGANDSISRASTNLLGGNKLSPRCRGLGTICDRLLHDHIYNS